MSLKSELLQRGHKMTSEGNVNDIFIPEQLQESFLEILYKLMNKSSFRKELRDWTFNGALSENVKAYLDSCSLFMQTPFSKNQNRYSKTFEWYISEVLKREFSAKAVGFGVTLKDANGGDEFDCIAVFDKGLFFVECKTGNAPIQNQVEVFARRDTELCAHYSMLILDRDYLFSKETPDQPKFTSADAQKKCIASISCIKGGAYHFYNVISINPASRHFFVCCANAKDLKENIRHIIRYTNVLNDSGTHTTRYSHEAVSFKSVSANPGHE